MLQETVQTPQARALTQEQVRGLLIGGAVGDALGLPREGLSPRRAQRLFASPHTMSLLPHIGLGSDDSEHLLFVAQCLIRHPHNPQRFAHRLAWCLRGWLLGLPAGIGLATLRATLKLWLGVPRSRSGVWSAGNGPAMRVAPIGLFHATNPLAVEELTHAATTLTHRDPRALVAARAVVHITALASQSTPETPPTLRSWLALLRCCGPDDQEWRGLLARLAWGLRRRQSVPAFAASLGLERGVSGYCYHSVPVAVYAVYRHWGDYRATVAAVVECGGDTDTVAAIAGAMAGVLVGEDSIPAEWRRGYRDWPRSIALLQQVADRLHQVVVSGRARPPIAYCWPGLILRNPLFLLVVLGHGLRRLLPPY